MRRISIVLTLGLTIILVASAALAQSTITPPTQATMSTQSTTATQPTTSTSSAPPGAFDNLSPGGQKIATALCNAQAGGCPPPQSSTQSTSSPAQTTSSTHHSPSLTRDQIAAMKQHTGWGQVFKQMQQNGQIPSSTKNLGQLVSGRYQAHSGTLGHTTITTASGRSQVVGTSGSRGGGEYFERGGSVSSASGGHSGVDADHSSAGSHGNAHGK